ncbi:MAG: hypothetical protein ACFB4I_07545 [Cyanophyceae cyanobacterium]
MQHSSIVGKIAKQAIYTKHGTPLIGKRQKITPALAEVAKRWQVWDQLWKAVNCNCSDRAYGVRCQHEELIRAALGYPVKLRVTDPQGSVILEVGELVTYSAVEQAKQANVLDRLLNSVYTK